MREAIAWSRDVKWQGTEENQDWEICVTERSTAFKFHSDLKAGFGNLGYDTGYLMIQ